MNCSFVCLDLQELRKDGFDLAETRYRELKPILDEVNLLLDGTCEGFINQVLVLLPT